MSLEIFHKPNEYELRFICVGCGGRIDRASVCDVPLFGFEQSSNGYIELYYCINCKRYICSHCVIGGAYSRMRCPSCNSVLKYTMKKARIRWTDENSHKKINNDIHNVKVIKIV